jgi:membrane fusion protein, heavy metal efflux system
MRTGTLILVIICSIPALIHGCRQEKKHRVETAPPQESNGELILTPEQVKVNHLELGQLEAYEFERVVTANGYLEALPRNRRTVSTWMGGTISELNLLPGDRVRSGALLFRLENPQLLQIQEDYLSSKESLKFLTDDFERQKLLAGENVTAQKILLKAQSEYMTVKARVEALRKKLSLLHIDPEKIQSEGMVSSISVLAPISGYITKVTATNGEFAPEASGILDIVETTPLMLGLQVFEKEITHVKEGQTVRFTLPDVTPAIFTARIEKVGRELDNNRTVSVHALFQAEDSLHLLPGMFVKANIVSHHFRAEALPETSLISGHGALFVLVRTNSGNDQWILKKKKVVTGFQDGKMVEILPESNISAGEMIVVKGAFGISSE